MTPIENESENDDDNNESDVDDNNVNGRENKKIVTIPISKYINLSVTSPRRVITELQFQGHRYFFSDFVELSVDFFILFVSILDVEIVSTKGVVFDPLAPCPLPFTILILSSCLEMDRGSLTLSSSAIASWIAFSNCIFSLRLL